MSNLVYIQEFVKKNIDKYDLEIVSTKSVGGKAMFRASIDNAIGGNYCDGGWEYDLEDALFALVEEIKKAQK